MSSIQYFQIQKVYILAFLSPKSLLQLSILKSKKLFPVTGWKKSFTVKIVTL